MRKFSVLITLALLVLTIGTAVAREDIAKFPSCELCGMDRNHFDYSRAVVELNDGTTVGTCSISCAEKAAAQRGNVKVIRVADYNTKELLFADQAIWVVGGSKRGVMTMKPKWSFASEEAARKFIAENEGNLAKYSDIKQAVHEEQSQAKHDKGHMQKKCCGNCNKKDTKQ